MVALRCVFEDNVQDGMRVYGQHVGRVRAGEVGRKASAELVECLVRNNGHDGLFVHCGEVTLRGGAISGNEQHGVLATVGAAVTVAEPEEASRTPRGRSAAARAARLAHYEVPRTAQGEAGRAVHRRRGGENHLSALHVDVQT